MSVFVHRIDQLKLHSGLKMLSKQDEKYLSSSVLKDIVTVVVNYIEILIVN